jgi:hypothetical protein
VAPTYITEWLPGVVLVLAGMRAVSINNNSVFAKENPEKHITP